MRVPSGDHATRMTFWSRPKIVCLAEPFGATVSVQIPPSLLPFWKEIRPFVFGWIDRAPVPGLGPTLLPLNVWTVNVTPATPIVRANAATRIRRAALGPDGGRLDSRL